MLIIAVVVVVVVVVVALAARGKKRHGEAKETMGCKSVIISDGAWWYGRPSNNTGEPTPHT